jgi:hypothetical protein
MPLLPPSRLNAARRRTPSHRAVGPAEPATPLNWADTQPLPIELDIGLRLPDAAQRPFHEALRGLHVRELAGDELFGHFFGPRFNRTA